MAIKLRKINWGTPWAFSSKNLDKFLLALTSIFGVMIISVANAKTQNTSQLLPTAIKPCIPSTQVAKAELVSKAHSGNVEYYLLNAYELNDTQGADLVISLTGDRCREIFYNPMGDAIPLASSVSKEVARQLTLGRYQQEIKKIGREKFQQRLNESTSQQKQVFWWDEEVWALRQLGFKIPQNVVVK